jgi:hypothetical protein
MGITEDTSLVEMRKIGIVLVLHLAVSRLVCKKVA